MENGYTNRIELVLGDIQGKLAILGEIQNKLATIDVSVAKLQVSVAKLQVSVAKLQEESIEAKERDLVLATALHRLATDHAEGLRRMEARHDVLVGRVDKIELRLGNLEDKVTALDTRIAALEVFAGDTTRRLERIESHLQLNGTPRSSSGNN
jgi:chromosome segregation ATPase